MVRQLDVLWFSCINASDMKASDTLIPQLPITILTWSVRGEIKCRATESADMEDGKLYLKPLWSGVSRDFEKFDGNGVYAGSAGGRVVL